MEWISTADRLPDDKQMVLCYIPDNNCFSYDNVRVTQLVLTFIEKYYGPHNVRCPNNGDSDSLWDVPAGPGDYWFHDVTHWMPLPDAPAQLSNESTNWPEIIGVESSHER